MKNLSKEIITKIENFHIKPKPKFSFLLKNYFVWVSASICLIFGALATAVIIYVLKNSDWDLYARTGNNWLKFTVISLPYFWIIFTALFGWLVYYNFKHTESGYRYRLSEIIMGIIIISIFLGVVFFYIGLGDIINQKFSEKMPFYPRLMEHRSRIWQRADNGLIIGIISKITPDDYLILNDFKNKKWKIDIKNAKYPPLQIKMIIKIIGKKINNDNFEAEIIRPDIGPAPFLKPF